jgi:dienelactone hydrolase
MAEVVLFHHAQGLTRGVVAFADELRGVGHIVHTLLFYSCVPVSAFGSAWPEGVPVQVHGMDADPIFVGEGDIDAARELVEQAEDAKLFLYADDQHYFADSSLPSYDADATALMVRRVLEFLRTP